MPLADLLYRCPECGHDPTEGEGDVVRCPACARSFERGSGDLLLSVQSPDGESQYVPTSVLVGQIEGRGGPLSRATGADGSTSYSAEVMVSWRVTEDPIRHRGELKGFSESMGEPTAATLTVNDDNVSISGPDVEPETWPFLEIRAVQTSSSSLQLSLPGDRLVQFQLPHDSPRRWEDLLRHLVREAYRRADRGFVVEFQPRIVTQ
ncbi:MAG: hypothetical protein ACR2QM_05155 [Longimicrobiales bacterium]